MTSSLTTYALTLAKVDVLSIGLAGLLLLPLLPVAYAARIPLHRRALVVCVCWGGAGVVALSVLTRAVGA